MSINLDTEALLHPKVTTFRLSDSKLKETGLHSETLNVKITIR